MPRAKPTLSRKDELKQQLAAALGESVADILTREEVVRDYGADIGYTNEKSLSNATAHGPRFYDAPLGRNGWSLYSRQDIRLFVQEPKKAQLGRHPWPHTATAPLALQSPAKSGAEAVLDNLTKDQDYKNMVLGRRPWI